MNTNTQSIGLGMTGKVWPRLSRINILWGWIVIWTEKHSNPVSLATGALRGAPLLAFSSSLSFALSFWQSDLSDPFFGMITFYIDELPWDRLWVFFTLSLSFSCIWFLPLELLVEALVFSTLELELIFLKFWVRNT